MVSQWFGSQPNVKPMVSQWFGSEAIVKPMVSPWFRSETIAKPMVSQWFQSETIAKSIEQVRSQRWHVTGHRSQVRGHRSRVTDHRSEVRGQRSQVDRNQTEGHRSQNSLPNLGQISSPEVQFPLWLLTFGPDSISAETFVRIPKKFKPDQKLIVTKEIEPLASKFEQALILDLWRLKGCNACRNQNRSWKNSYHGGALQPDTGDERYRTRVHPHWLTFL